MIVFLHIPKTAGSTFQFILENSFGISACHTNHTKRPTFTQADVDFARRIFPRLRSLAGHNLVDPLSLSIVDPFYITFLREPVARVISHYQDNALGTKSPLSFEETLRSNPYFQNLHVRMMAGGENLDRARRFIEKCSFVGLTEKFDLSLHVLKRLSPRPLNFHYKRKRVQRDNSIRTRLEQNPKMIEVAREYNRLDLALYAFATEEVFPRLCAQAGFQTTDTVESFDHYTSEMKIKFLACQGYNMLFYRQLNKLLNGNARKSPNIPW